MENKVVMTKNDCEVIHADWGSVTLFASGSMRNSNDVTFGRCDIKMGCENKLHIHPNCTEIIHVLKGRVLHSYNEENYVLEEGDTITIPQNVAHNAKNIGEQDVILMIVFTDPNRETAPVK